jgi:hypothetical protein
LNGKHQTVPGLIPVWLIAASIELNSGVHSNLPTPAERLIRRGAREGLGHVVMMNQLREWGDYGNELDARTKKRDDSGLFRLDTRCLRFLSNGFHIERYRD